MRVSLILAAFLTTLAFHFAWEMLQASTFEEFAATVWEGTVRCFAAALGDVLIAGGAYLGTALVFRHASWPLRHGWVAPAVTWIALGVIVTVMFELWALERGRWAYGPSMPLVFGIGLLPLLQWVVVPALTLTLVRRLAGRMGTP